MPFSERAKLTALAIVHIFETSKPLGDYSAVAVLDDGAGISYGVNQFTHKSGSLYRVVKKYLQLGGQVQREMLEKAAGLFTEKHHSIIESVSQNKSIKQALREAGKTPEMQEAQRYVMETMYLRPAIEACEGSKFTLPLSLAVIYDSINHGSYAKIRDRNSQRRENFSSDLKFEIAWITEYVRDRDAWLESVARLAKTDYRTDFFLAQIARKNWHLKLPLTVHGYRLTEEILFPKDDFELEVDTAFEEIKKKPEPDLETPATSASISEVSKVSAEGDAEKLPSVKPPPPAAQDGEAATAAQQPIQNAENITNVNTSDKAALPPDFKPEVKEVGAPAKEDSAKTSTKMVIAGYTVPVFIAGIIKVIQDLISQGYVDSRELGNAVIQFLFQNTRFVFYGILLIVVGLMLKKLYRQITLWLAMWINTKPDRHDVRVIPQ